MIQEILGYIIVSGVWGITNPLIKKGTEGIEKIEVNKSPFLLYKIIYELKFLILNYKVI